LRIGVGGWVERGTEQVRDDRSGDVAEGHEQHVGQCSDQQGVRVLAGGG